MGILFTESHVREGFSEKNSRFLTLSKIGAEGMKNHKLFFSKFSLDIFSMGEVIVVMSKLFSHKNVRLF